MTRNNNARSKQNRRKLKAKSNRITNILQAIFLRKITKKKIKQRGKTITGPVIKYAIDIRQLFPEGGGGYLFDHTFHKSLNQRQKRKRARQIGKY